MAQGVLKNCKKANGDLPSGKTELDYDEHVLQEMYTYLKGSSVFVDTGTVSIDDDAGDDDTPAPSPVTVPNTISNPVVATNHVPATNDGEVETAVVTPLEMDNESLLPIPPETYFFQGFLGFK